MPQLSPHFSEDSHRAETLVFLAAYLQKVRKPQHSPNKIVVQSAADGGDLLHGGGG